MNLAGRTSVGETPVELAADTKRVMGVRMPVAGALSKGSILLDGLGSGGSPSLAQQSCRMVVYDIASKLLAQSSEVVVPAGMPAQWVDFRFPDTKGELFLPPGARFTAGAGDLYAGLHGGATGDVIRFYTTDPFGLGSKWNSDTYADGASSVFGAATALTSNFSLTLSYFVPYASERPDETDLYYSRLPFQEAQEIFSLGGPQGLPQVVNVGWHDTFLDPERGSNALVREGGAFAGLLGERIKLTAGQRSVYAYVHNLADSDVVDWDVSLTRHLYAQLSELAATTIPTVLEVIV